MAFETEQANSITPTDVVSSIMAPALVQSVVALPLIVTQDPPAETNVKKWPKKGSLTAEAITESTAYAFSANSELTDTSVTTTSTGFGVVSKLTVHAKRFGAIDESRLYTEQAMAIGRDLDDEILALFSGFSSQVTSTTILTVADIMQALYLVQSGTAGVSGGQLNGVFDYKGINEVRKEIIASGAAVFTQPQQTSLLAGTQQGNGFVGQLPGVDLYQTNGLPTDTGDDVALVFDPNLAICGDVELQPQTMRVEKISEGFYVELGSYTFADFAEYNDAAGVGVKSDT